MSSYLCPVVVLTFFVSEGMSWRCVLLQAPQQKTTSCGEVTGGTHQTQQHIGLFADCLGLSDCKKIGFGPRLLDCWHQVAETALIQCTIYHVILQKPGTFHQYHHMIITCCTTHSEGCCSFVGICDHRWQIYECVTNYGTNHRASHAQNISSDIKNSSLIYWVALMWRRCIQ